MSNSFINCFENYSDAIESWRDHSSNTATTLVHFSSHHDLFPLAFRQLFEPAMASGMTKKIVWVAPDALFKDSRSEKKLAHWLQNHLRTTTTLSSHHIECQLGSVRFIAIPFSQLFSEVTDTDASAHLNIDLSYFLEGGMNSPKPYFQVKPKAWILPSTFWKRFACYRAHFSLVNIFYSIQQATVPLHCKYFGDLLESAFYLPYFEMIDSPPVGSAAESYYRFLEVFKESRNLNVEEARIAWNQTIRRDSSYDTVLALEGLKLEAHGHGKKALVIYDRMISIAPEWATLHIVRGKALGRLGRWTAAATAFFDAARLKRRFDEELAYWMGQCAFHHRDYSSAEAYWKLALEKNPGHTPSRNALSELQVAY